MNIEWWTGGDPLESSTFVTGYAFFFKLARFVVNLNSKKIFLLRMALPVQKLTMGPAQLFTNNNTSFKYFFQTETYLQLQVLTSVINGHIYFSIHF
jgi:hypothetical protein